MDDTLRALAEASRNTAIDEYKDILGRSLYDAITRSNCKDDYSVGLRNGMRFALYLATGCEPEFESCCSSDPIITDVKTLSDRITTLLDNMKDINDKADALLKELDDTND